MGWRVSAPPHRSSRRSAARARPQASLCQHPPSAPAPRCPLRSRVCSLQSNEDKFYTDWEEAFDSFDQMGLHEGLLRGIYAYGEQGPRWPFLLGRVFEDLGVAADGLRCAAALS